MPAVALREPLAKACLASSRTGARSATTRIPWGLVLSNGLVTVLSLRTGRTASVPEPHQLVVQGDIDGLADAGRELFGLVKDRVARGLGRSQGGGSDKDSFALSGPSPDEWDAAD